MFIFERGGQDYVHPIHLVPKMDPHSCIPKWKFHLFLYPLSYAAMVFKLSKLEPVKKVGVENFPAKL